MGHDVNIHEDVYRLHDSMDSVSLTELLRWYEMHKLETPIQSKKFGLFLRRRSDKPYIDTQSTLLNHQSHLLLLPSEALQAMAISIWPGSSWTDIFRALHTSAASIHHNWHVRFEEKAQEVDRAIQEFTHWWGWLLGGSARLRSRSGSDGHGWGRTGTQADHAALHVSRHRARHCIQFTKHSAETHCWQCCNSSVWNDTQIHSMPKICANDILNRLLISSRFPAATIPVITVSAQTGHAAFNIAGTTIHRLLCLTTKLQSTESGQPTCHQEHTPHHRWSEHGFITNTAIHTPATHSSHDQSTYTDNYYA